MSINKKTHISKSGKSVLIFQRQNVGDPVIGSQLAKDVVKDNKPQAPVNPAVPASHANGEIRANEKSNLTNLREFQQRTVPSAEN